MDSTWFCFTWDVPADGYRWLPGRPINQGPRSKPSPYLTRLTTYTDSFLNRRYDAHQVPRSLFRTFTDVPTTEEGILAFANEYGGLGVAEPFQPKVSDVTVVGEPLQGEPFARWQQEIVTMRQLTALWDLCQKKDLEGLARHIRWTDDHGPRTVRYSHSCGEPDEGEVAGTSSDEVVLASPSHHPEWLVQWSPGDVMLPALFYLADEINQHLHFREGMRMMWNPTQKQLALRLPVGTLRDLLWAQFAEAIVSERSFRKCRTCGTWFELMPGLARTNRLFCSEGCRSKLYRTRQEEARRLHGEGKSVKEIAQHLESDVRTIKGWVSSKQ
ncbi:MAG: hypothetical protein JNM56_14050 [Planctomycetia bacterium]|nr:hypothetical protein [Planctomycetia bacterium]